MKFEAGIPDEGNRVKLNSEEMIYQAERAGRLRALQDENARHG